MKAIIWSGLVLVATSTRVLAATDVGIDAQCAEDPVGQIVAHEIRQELERSAALRYSELPSVLLSIVCIKPSETTFATVSTFSYTVQVSVGLPKNLLLVSGIRLSGRERTRETARSLVADVGNAVREFQEDVVAGKYNAVVK